MTDVFPYDTQAVTGKVRRRKLHAQYGDGYSQSALDGINNKVQTWPFVYTGSKAEVTAIATWLDNHPGAFLYTPDLGVQGYYECDEYDLAGQEKDTWQISATFNQVFRTA